MHNPQMTHACTSACRCSRTRRRPSEAERPERPPVWCGVCMCIVIVIVVVELAMRGLFVHCDSEWCCVVGSTDMCVYVCEFVYYDINQPTNQQTNGQPTPPTHTYTHPPPTHPKIRTQIRPRHLRVDRPELPQDQGAQGPLAQFLGLLRRSAGRRRPALRAGAYAPVTGAGRCGPVVCV